MNLTLLDFWRKNCLQNIYKPFLTSNALWFNYFMQKSCLPSTLRLGFCCVEVLNDWVLPTVVQKGDKVDLRCNFELSGENMYSLKWYRDNVEFYRYIPSGGLGNRVSGLWLSLT